jgi:hypothetical protein
MTAEGREGASEPGTKRLIAPLPLLRRADSVIVQRVSSSKIRDYLPGNIPHSAVIPPSTNRRVPVT